MNGLTAFQRDVLYVIARGGELSGMEVKREIEDYYAKDVNHGQLYPNLNKLEEMGLIEKQQVDQRSNAYGLTTDGENTLRNRREWEREKASELLDGL